MESPFTHLLELLAEIADPRRAEGKLYKLLRRHHRRHALSKKSSSVPPRGVAGRQRHPPPTPSAAIGASKTAFTTPADGTMAEDASRVRKNPGIMARIRSFAANILRAKKVTNMTDARYRNALGGLDHLAKYKLT